MTKTFTGGANISYDTSDWTTTAKPTNLADGSLVYHTDTANTALTGLWLFGFIRDNNAGAYGPQVAQAWRQVSFDPSSFVSGSGGTMTGPLEVPGWLRVTQPSTAQRILIGNQDSGGVNRPSIIQGANGVLQFGYGNTWLGNGGTLTIGLQVDPAGGANGLTWQTSKVWHQANDGANSGLDADLLDGQEGSFYQNASNINAGVLTIARGGTNTTTTVTGGIAFGQSATALSYSAAGTATTGSGTTQNWQVLTSGGTGTPLWVNTTSLNVAYAGSAGSAGSATSASLSSTQPDSDASTNIATTAYVKSLFASASTSGVLDWNDVSNARPGVGPTILLGNASNGPGSSSYFHPLNIEYSALDGTGQITQLGICYANPANELYMRGRYSGSWSAWVRYLNSSNFNTYSPTLTGGGATGTWALTGLALGGASLPGTGGLNMTGTLSAGNITGTTLALNGASTPAAGGLNMTGNLSANGSISAGTTLSVTQGATMNTLAIGGATAPAAGGLNMTGALSAGGTITATQTIQTTNGNLYTTNGSIFAPNGDAVIGNNGSTGWVTLYGGTTTRTGYIAFTAANGNRQGYIGYSPGTAAGDTGTITYIGGTHSFTGDISTNGNVTAYASDGRLKTNVMPIVNAVAKVQRLGGYVYEWDAELCRRVGFTPANPIEHGLIAQDVEVVMPDAVAPAPFDPEYKTVRYERLVALLTAAINEQQKQIDEQQAMLTTLRAEVDKLKGV